MAPAPPEGLTVSTLSSAKGAQLRFWIIQTNEAAEKKAINVTVTVDQLRTNLAEYYGFDLIGINPREDNVTAPSQCVFNTAERCAETICFGDAFSCLETKSFILKTKQTGVKQHSVFDHPHHRDLPF
jgi:hypothetical protein